MTKRVMMQFRRTVVIASLTTTLAACSKTAPPIPVVVQVLHPTGDAAKHYGTALAITPLVSRLTPDVSSLTPQAPSPRAQISDYGLDGVFDMWIPDPPLEPDSLAILTAMNPWPRYVRLVPAPRTVDCYRWRRTPMASRPIPCRRLP
jgi:hypothetical protein